MRCVLQRVDRVDIRVGGESISSIGKGILVFLAVEQGDRESDVDYLCDKIVNLRIFEDESGKMDRSLLDVDGDLLVVSQFTLLGDCRKGRRPSFTRAENGEQARKQYDCFVNRARERIRHVAQGQFQAMMLVELVNNGPVTILLDSRTGL
ncbi:MAG: D-aminoacyl-tRNA deacylase [Syntrophales bacterium]